MGKKVCKGRDEEEGVKKISVHLLKRRDLCEDLGHRWEDLTFTGRKLQLL